MAPIAGALAAVCALTALAVIPPLPAAAAENNALAEKPFADHHLVLQLSDDDAKKQSLVISVAYNLLKFYGPDRIAIEVVSLRAGHRAVARRQPEPQAGRQPGRTRR